MIRLLRPPRKTIIETFHHRLNALININTQEAFVIDINICRLINVTNLLKYIHVIYF